MYVFLTDSVLLQFGVGDRGGGPLSVSIVSLPKIPQVLGDGWNG